MEVINYELYTKHTRSIPNHNCWVVILHRATNKKRKPYFFDTLYFLCALRRSHDLDVENAMSHQCSMNIDTFGIP
jgi:hypothetical protein